MSNSTATIWFIGAPSVWLLHTPSHWPPLFLGNDGLFVSTKAKPSTVLFCERMLSVNYVLKDVDAVRFPFHSLGFPLRIPPSRLVVRVSCVRHDSHGTDAQTVEAKGCSMGASNVGIATTFSGRICMHVEVKRRGMHHISHSITTICMLCVHMVKKSACRGMASISMPSQWDNIGGLFDPYGQVEVLHFSYIIEASSNTNCK